MAVLTLTEDVLGLVMQFTIDNLRDWSIMQQVSNVFKRCARRPQTLFGFTITLTAARLYRLESRLGPSLVRGVRKLKVRKLTATGITVLQKLVDLQTLDLSPCNYTVTDADLLQALNPLVKLQTLNISFCHSITDTGVLQALSHLTALQVLNIGGCTRITDECVRVLIERVPLVLHYRQDGPKFFFFGTGFGLRLRDIDTIAY